jgi:hypothetical protein
MHAVEPRDPRRPGPHHHGRVLRVLVALGSEPAVRCWSGQWLAPHERAGRR